jgi:hypothetical protein
MVAGLATALAPARVARAGEGADVQELKREIGQLRAEVQALQTVLAETTELERQRSANLTRAMKASEAPMPPSAAPAAVDTPSAAPAAAKPAASSDKGKSAKKDRHRRHSPRNRSRDR